MDQAEEKRHFRIHSSRIIHQIEEEEAVILDYDSGFYYSADAAGAVIWGLVVAGAAVGEIVRELCGRYSGSEEQIERGTQSFLDELLKEELIRPGPDGDVRPDYVSAASSSSSVLPLFQIPALHKYTDMRDIVLLDPIHEVSEEGWPEAKKSSGE